MRKKQNTNTQSIYTVASLAGCSPSTVSRVLNNSAPVNAEMRERILLAMRKIHFTSRKRLPQIGLLVTGLHGATMTSYVSRMVRRIFLELAKYSFCVKYIDGDDRNLNIPDELDAVVSLAYNDSLDRLAEKTKVPVIAINHPLHRAKAYQIMSDHSQGARMAAEYLLTMGHRRIMFLEMNRNFWGGNERLNGIRKSIEKYSDAVLFPGFTEEEPLNNLLLRMRSEKCTGLINFSDNHLIQVPFMLTQTMNVRIPDEISIVTEDLPGIFDFHMPPLTAIRQPLDKLVLTAANVLENVLKGNPPSENQIIFENELIIRDSVRRIPVK